MSHKFEVPQPVTAQPAIEHPGVLVKAIITGNGSNVSKTATAIKMDRSSLQLVTQGQYGVSRDLAFKLGAYFGDAAADLLIAAIRAYEDQGATQERAKWAEKIAPMARKEGEAVNLPDHPAYEMTNRIETLASIGYVVTNYDEERLEELSREMDLPVDDVRHLLAGLVDRDTMTGSSRT